MKLRLRIIALLLVALISLSSCEFIYGLNDYVDGTGSVSGSTQKTESDTTTQTKPTDQTPPVTTKPVVDVPDLDYSDYSITKEELATRYNLTQETVDLAKSHLDAMIENAYDVQNIEAVYKCENDFTELYYQVDQQRVIAMIIYYCDMSDAEAEEDYFNTVKWLNELYDDYSKAIAAMVDTPCADEYFEGWSQELIDSYVNQDSAVTVLSNEVQELKLQYNKLSEDDPEYDAKCVEIYKQLVTKNNQLARIYGYENYYEYASVNVYGRDYEKDDIAIFREYVIQYIAPHIVDVWIKKSSYTEWNNRDHVAMVEEFVYYPFNYNEDRNYLVSYLDSLTGQMGDAMRDMFENKNCIFATSEYSHPTAFNISLNGYDTSFCLFGKGRHDASTLAHEIGHYYASIVNPSLYNYDLKETHSQGNEALLTNYCKEFMPKAVYDAVRAEQIYTLCYSIIMASLVDEFEERVYSLPSVENMTVDDFTEIMEEISEPYGGADLVEHIFGYNPDTYWKLTAINNPVYYISYAVSASAALQIFAIAEQDYDAAIRTYTSLVEETYWNDGFLGALNKAGLTTPFEEETFITIEEVFSK